jgi:hypothetical protein
MAAIVPTPYDHPSLLRALSLEEPGAGILHDGISERVVGKLERTRS